jgi:hypothetical protein
MKTDEFAGKAANPILVMAGHSASEDARERAFARPSTSLILKSKTWMPGSADKFTQSAQA